MRAKVAGRAGRSCCSNAMPAAQLQAQAVSTDLALIKALGGGYRCRRTPDRHRTSLPLFRYCRSRFDHERH